MPSMALGRLAILQLLQAVDLEVVIRANALMPGLIPPPHLLRAALTPPALLGAPRTHQQSLPLAPILAPLDLGHPLTRPSSIVQLLHIVVGLHLPVMTLQPSVVGRLLGLLATTLRRLHAMGVVATGDMLLQHTTLSRVLLVLRTLFA